MLSLCGAVVVNGWEWFDPEFMEKIVEVFGKKKGGNRRVTDGKKEKP
jgi:hypothetical protein